jgi:hypothetical protein
MSFCASASRCACLNDWDGPLTVNHILNLLLDLKRTLAGANSRVILIIVFRESVPTPDDYLLDCLQGALPALLNCCEQLLVVVEGTTADRDSIRIAFQTTRRTPIKQTLPEMFDALGAAFTRAQAFAPHDVLELQRQALRESLLPSRCIG